MKVHTGYPGHGRSGYICGFCRKPIDVQYWRVFHIGDPDGWVRTHYECGEGMRTVLMLRPGGFSEGAWQGVWSDHG